MDYSLDPERLLQQIWRCKYLAESDLKKLCLRVRDLLLEESNVKHVKGPVTCCGDLHGQFYDLLELFKTGGKPPDKNYLFMGDFVDRGYYSLETFTLLMSLKAAYPDRITLLRGNHESRTVTQVYGFYDECLTKYGNANGWRYCCQVFDALTLTAIIDNEVFCVHGGLSPDIRTVDQIRMIMRHVEIPQSGPFCDMMWSDPDDAVGTWQISPRGSGWFFGDRVTAEFLRVNNLQLVCRSHQLVMEGYKYQFEDKLLTVWSAPNYCYRCGNVAAILEINGSNKKLITFGPSEQNETYKPPKTTPPYFL